MALDPTLKALGESLVRAIAKANGHPDPDGYVAAVAEHFDSPVANAPAQPEEPANV